MRQWTQLDGHVACGYTFASNFFKRIIDSLQALKMPYCSNKPVPTPGHLLPRPKISAPAGSKKEEENSLKRKMVDSMADSGDNHEDVS